MISHFPSSSLGFEKQSGFSPLEREVSGGPSPKKEGKKDVEYIYFDYILLLTNGKTFSDTTI